MMSMMFLSMLLMSWTLSRKMTSRTVSKDDPVSITEAIRTLDTLSRHQEQQQNIDKCFDVNGFRGLNRHYSNLVFQPIYQYTSLTITKPHPLRAAGSAV